MERDTKVKLFNIYETNSLRAAHQLFGIPYHEKPTDDIKKKYKMNGTHKLAGLRSNEIFFFPNTDFPIFRQMTTHELSTNAKIVDYEGREVVNVGADTVRIGPETYQKFRQYRDELRRNLLKSMGVHRTRKQYDEMEELYVAGNPYDAISNPHGRVKGDTIISRMLEEYDMFTEQLANFILSLTHVLYYEPYTLRDKPTKILETVYKQSIELCMPIKKAFEKQLLEEYVMVDLAKKVLGADLGM